MAPPLDHRGRLAWQAFVLATGLLGAFAAAWAAGTCADYLKALAVRESGLNAQAHNGYGYVGLWQMGEAALVDAGYYRPDGTGANDWRGSWTGLGGITSLQDFKNSPAAQAAAVAAYQQRVWGYVRSLGLDAYLGSTVGGVAVTQSGLVAAAHLVGTGNLARFLRSGGTVVPTDGNGTPLTEYLATFGGYSLFGAGANCADWASGQPTGGVAADWSDLPQASPGPSFGEAPGSMTSNPGDAFYGMSGHTAGALGQLIRLAAAAVLLLLAAWSWLGSWAQFSGGRLPLHLLLSTNQRMVILVVAVLVLMS